MGFGLFGKLPQKRDFLSVNLPSAVLHPFETWLQSAVAASRSEIGRGWEDYYLVAPIWRFWFGREIFGTVCAGALMPSVDQVGRYFPLAIMYVADRDEAFPPPLQSPLDDWYRAVEQRLLSVLSEDDRADMGNLLVGLPTPKQVEDAAAAAPVVAPAPPAWQVPEPSPEVPAVTAEEPAPPPAPPVAAPLAVLGETPPSPPPTEAPIAPLSATPLPWDVPEEKVGPEATTAAPPTSPAPIPAPPTVTAMPAAAGVSWDLPETPAPTPEAAAQTASDPTPAATPAGAVWDLPAAAPVTPPQPTPAAVPAVADAPPIANSAVWDMPEATPSVPSLPVSSEAKAADEPSSSEPPAAPATSVPPGAAGPGGSAQAADVGEPPSVSAPASSAPPPAPRVRISDFKGSLLVAVEANGTVANALAELRELDYRHAASGRSYWWCTVSATGSALVHAGKGLPDPYFFSRMLMWKANET